MKRPSATCSWGSWRMEGYTASAVADGQAALDYLHVHPPPCCIVLDLYMPDMDGWQFHPAQLRTPALVGIPVIVMPAVAHALQPLAWFQAAGYLQKPFALNAVLALVAPLCAASTSVHVVALWGSSYSFIHSIATCQQSTGSFILPHAYPPE